MRGAFIWGKSIPGCRGRGSGIRNMTRSSQRGHSNDPGDRVQKEARSRGALGATASSSSFTSSEVETPGGFRAQQRQNPTEVFQGAHCVRSRFRERESPVVGGRAVRRPWQR